MTIFRTLDDALIDRVFQPVVNRLQVSHVGHIAIPCYALYVGAQIGRALVLHAQGLLGEQAPAIAFDVAVACLIYGLAIVLNRNGRARPNPVRHSPVCRLYRLASLFLTLWRFSVVPLSGISTQRRSCRGRLRAMGGWALLRKLRQPAPAAESQGRSRRGAERGLRTGAGQAAVRPDATQVR